MPYHYEYISLYDPSVASKPRHLAYYELGEKTNPDVIICTHGLSRNGRDFERLAKALAGKYRVICPDMAGRGNSNWLTSKTDYNYPLYLSDVNALLEQLGLSQVSWVGTSMGGIIGMMLAASKPQAIKKLVLNDIGKTVSAEGLRRILSYVGMSTTFNNRASANAYLKSIIAPFGISSDEEWRYMFEASFLALPEERYALRYDPDISQPFRESASKADTIANIDLSMFWNAIACPTLILRGAVSDILTHETAMEMQISRPDVTLVEIHGVGHAPALINNEQIRTVTDWLDRGA